MSNGNDKNNNEPEQEAPDNDVTPPKIDLVTNSYDYDRDNNGEILNEDDD